MMDHALVHFYQDAISNVPKSVVWQLILICYKNNIWELQLSNGMLTMNDEIRAAQIWRSNKGARDVFLEKLEEHERDTWCRYT